MFAAAAAVAVVVDPFIVMAAAAAVVPIRELATVDTYSNYTQFASEICYFDSETITFTEIRRIFESKYLISQTLYCMLNISGQFLSLLRHYIHAFEFTLGYIVTLRAISDYFL